MHIDKISSMKKKTTCKVGTTLQLYKETILVIKSTQQYNLATSVTITINLVFSPAHMILNKKAIRARLY